MEHANGNTAVLIQSGLVEVFRGVLFRLKDPLYDCLGVTFVFLLFAHFTVTSHEDL